MKNNKLLIPIVTLLYCTAFAMPVFAQTDPIASVTDIPSKSISAIEKKYANLDNKLNKGLAKMLSKLQKQENKLHKKLQAKDSLAATQLFNGTEQQYEQLQQQLKNPLAGSRVSNYIPRLDSLQTATRFLDQSGLLPTAKLGEVKQLSSELSQLESRLHAAEDIEAFLKQRKELLTSQLEKFGLTKELQQIKKQTYYYRQQLEEYKTLFNDQQKLEAKALEVLGKIPAFQKFMQQNSYLSQLFPSPAGAGSSDPSVALAGLQTRASVDALLQQRFGSSMGPPSGAGGMDNPLEQGMQAAQQQLNALKDKINELGGGSSDMNMPEGFTPNKQKTKTFLKRLEPGINIQSQRNSNYLPAITDITLTLGYKINDKSVIGIGAGYKLGWGKPLKDIKLSSEGASLRSFLDWKVKGSWWISGGWEYNYLQSFGSFNTLRYDYANWQRSALLGMTKKFKAGKHSSNVQLLYDFLWRDNPGSQPLKFRVGWGW